MLVDEFGALPRVELRIGIGFGKARVGSPNELGQWSGEAFELAAKALAKLSIGSGRLALLSPIPAMNEEFEVHLALLDTVLRRWTDDQRDTLFKLLYYRHGQTQLAEQFGVTQSAISQRLRGAGWDGVQSLLDRYKELMNHKHSRQGEG